MSGSIEAYNELYESSVSHGIRKAAHVKQNKNSLKEENEKLEKEIKAFEGEIVELKKKMQAMETSDREETAREKTFKESRRLEDRKCRIQKNTGANAFARNRSHQQLTQ